MGAGADLNLPVFDADQVAAADGCGAAGVPPGVASEPVLGVGVGIDKPDPSVVADGEGFACRVGPDRKIVGLGGGVDGGGHWGCVLSWCGRAGVFGLGGFDEGEFVPVGGGHFAPTGASHGSVA